MRTIKLQFLILLLAAGAALDAFAATITVTSPDDDGGVGTLREALAIAQDGDTINFDPAMLPATIVLSGSALEIVDKGVTIEGPGKDELTVDGRGLSSVFFVWSKGKIVTISGLTIVNGNNPNGGGVASWESTLMLTDCALSDNYAQEGGGGVYFAFGDLHITNCTLSNNTSGVSETYAGGGAVAFLAAPLADGPTVYPTLTIEHSILTGNTAPFGGGISIAVAGWPFATVLASVTVTDTTLSNNSANSEWSAAYGGGIAIAVFGDETSDYSSVELTLENSTLSGNSATNSLTAIGGGIVISGQSRYSAIVNVQNSTLSGNSASATNGFGGGGAIFAAGEGSLFLGNSTLSDNWSQSVEGSYAGGIFNAGHEIYVWNTILNAGPSGANLDQYVVEGEESYGNFYSGGYNLSSDDGGGFLNDSTDQVDSDPLLEPLADNGGPTFTHALRADSPAIDAGSAFDMDFNPVDTDQRGVTRPQGSGDDIGAFEAEFGEYCWSGVLPPVNPDGTSVFKVRSTIPLKFMLIDCSAGITDLVATLSFAKVDNSVAGAVNESVSTAAATTGNQFRYDPAADQYVFNWSTKGLSAGTYQLSIELGDGVTRTVNLDLR